MSDDNVIVQLLRAREILDRAPIPVQNRCGWINVKGKVVSINAVQGRKRRKEGQGQRKREVMLGRINGFSFYQEPTTMNVRDFVTSITKELPGSIGAAQVGQVVKLTLDGFASLPDAEIAREVSRRRKALKRKVEKAAAKARLDKACGSGSANCILPRKK